MAKFDFGNILNACENVAFGNLFMNIWFLFRENKLCSLMFLRDLVAKEDHGGALMGHFGISKTIDVLNEHLLWYHMKHNV